MGEAPSWWIMKAPKPQWSEPREYCPLSLATSPWLVKCGSGSGRAVEAVEQSIELSLAAATHSLHYPSTGPPLHQPSMDPNMVSILLCRKSHGDSTRNSKGGRSTEYRVRSGKGSTWGLLESHWRLQCGVTEYGLVFSRGPGLLPLGFWTQGHSPVNLRKQALTLSSNPYMYSRVHVLSSTTMNSLDHNDVGSHTIPDAIVAKNLLS